MGKAKHDSMEQKSVWHLVNCINIMLFTEILNPRMYCWMLKVTFVSPILDWLNVKFLIIALHTLFVEHQNTLHQRLSRKQGMVKQLIGGLLVTLFTKCSQ